MTTYAIRRHTPHRAFEGNDIVSTYAIRRQGLQAEIQQIVKRYIIDHKFKPGDALPGEGELARQIGISRPSLREAMKVLQTIGAIETRHGSGTYVGSLSLDSLTEGLAFQLGVAAHHSQGVPTDLLDLIDMREAIEVQQIRRVAGMHTSEQIARLRIVNEQLLTADMATTFRTRDRDLHQRFYAPLKSRVASEFIRCFWKISNLGTYPFETSMRESIVEDHAAIIDALEDRDADAASDAMTRHMRHMVSTLSASYNGEQLLENAISPSGKEYA